VKYESPCTYQSKDYDQGLSFGKEGQTPRSKIKVMISNKSLARRNTQMKYESPSTNQSNVITKVKVFADRGQTDGQTE
jgi:hypothetical protein